MSDSIIQYGPSGNTKEIENILNHIFSSNMNITDSNKKPTPLCIWGTHGLGKTEMVKDYAKQRGWKFSYIAPAQFEEMGDLHGMPYVSESPKGVKRTLFSPPDWVPMEEGPGILLIDDINRADDRILRGCMQLLQNYELSSWKLPQKWLIVSTANPEGADYSVTPMDDAMLTRMLHVTMKFDVETWAEWAMQEGLDSRGIDFLLTYPEVVTGIRTTARSITQFLQQIDSLKDLNNPENLEMVQILGRGTLEDETVDKFLHFCKFIQQTLIQPLDILEAEDFERDISMKLKSCHIVLDS